MHISGTVCYIKCNQPWFTLNTPPHLVGKVPGTLVRSLFSASIWEIFYIEQNKTISKDLLSGCKNENDLAYSACSISPGRKLSYEGVTFSHKSKAVSHWHEEKVLLVHPWESIHIVALIHWCALKFKRQNRGILFMHSDFFPPMENTTNQLIFSRWKCHFDLWNGCQNLPKWLKTVTLHTPSLKLECLSYKMLPRHTCHEDSTPRSIVLKKIV